MLNVTRTVVNNLARRCTCLNKEALSSPTSYLKSQQVLTHNQVSFVIPWAVCAMCILHQLVFEFDRCKNS